MSRGARRGPQLSPHKGAAWGAGRRWGPAVQVQNGRMPLRGVQPCPASRAPSAPSMHPWSPGNSVAGGRELGPNPPASALAPAPKPHTPAPGPHTPAPAPASRTGLRPGTAAPVERVGQPGVQGGGPQGQAVGSLFSSRGRCPWPGPAQVPGGDFRVQATGRAREAPMAPSIVLGGRRSGVAPPPRPAGPAGLLGLDSTPPRGQHRAETPAPSHLCLVAWTQPRRAAKPPVPTPGRGL